MSWFAPPGRADMEVIRKQHLRFRETPFLFESLQAISVPVLILNDKRQLVFANQAFIHVSGAKTLESILGQRAGEALGCAYAELMEEGCGSSEYCTECGAVRSILKGLEGIEDIGECNISRGKLMDPLDLRVTVSPVEFERERYVIFSAIDIADEKRKEVLERLFLHDVRNMVGGINGLSEALTRLSPDDLPKYLEMIRELSDNLLDEINFFSQLSVAESGTLKPSIESANAIRILYKTKQLYLNHQVGKGKDILIEASEEDISFSTDESLLIRVIGNMCKNALEATDPGGIVRLSCQREEEGVRFSVHNEGQMPEDVQLQIFQRSFSTKGSGRGIGTYSIKLLSEQYLGGKVGFTSSREEGTTFFGIYPYNPGS